MNVKENFTKFQTEKNKRSFTGIFPVNSQHVSNQHSGQAIFEKVVDTSIEK